MTTQVIEVQGKVERGLATNVGLSAAVAQFVVAGLLVLMGDRSPEAVAAFVGAVLTLLTVLGGRYLQAALWLREGARAVEPYALSFGEALRSGVPDGDDGVLAVSEGGLPVGVADETVSVPDPERVFDEGEEYGAGGEAR